jgi:hypothetical protein
MADLIWPSANPGNLRKTPCDAPRFGTLARRLEDPALHQLLDGFDAGFKPDEEADLAWFPAWILIAEPARASVLRETQVLWVPEILNGEFRKF